MVEQSKNDEEIKDETFVEVPAILEKFKAAAAVTDGKHFSLCNQSQFAFLSSARKW